MEGLGTGDGRGFGPETYFRAKICAILDSGVARAPGVVSTTTSHPFCHLLLKKRRNLIGMDNYRFQAIKIH